MVVRVQTSIFFPATISDHAKKASTQCKEPDPRPSIRALLNPPTYRVFPMIYPGFEWWRLLGGDVPPRGPPDRVAAGVCSESKAKAAYGRPSHGALPNRAGGILLLSSWIRALQLACILNVLRSSWLLQLVGDFKCKKLSCSVKLDAAIVLQPLFAASHWKQLPVMSGTFAKGSIRCAG